MATQAWELLHILNAVRDLQDVHTLNVFSRHDVPERAYRKLGVEVASFQLPRSERDFQEGFSRLMAAVLRERARILINTSP
jgi:hypothetical protein